ncbi:MAG: hypothetical protein IJF73_00810 [Clostridia bacterium]|nr:hypothetical protein [Clostridia bacterium]
MKRLSALLLLLSLVFSVGGVYATWNYANLGPTLSSLEMPVRLGEFNWAGSGDLPTDSEIGEDHISLIENIVSHTEHGLNAKGSYLNEQIAARKKGSLTWQGRDTLGSMAVTQSEELTDIFGLAASNLTFLIQFVSDTEYYVFTTSVYLGERGAINIWGNNSKPGNPTVPIGEAVHPIYRTRLQKTNGTWAAVETVKGYATSAWYEESRRNATATQIPSFDPDTFKEGTPS